MDTVWYNKKEKSKYYMKEYFSITKTSFHFTFTP